MILIFGVVFRLLSWGSFVSGVTAAALAALNDTARAQLAELGLALILASVLLSIPAVKLCNRALDGQR